MICLTDPQLVNRRKARAGTPVSWILHSFLPLFSPSKLLVTFILFTCWKSLLVSGKIHHAIVPFCWDMILHQLTKELGLCFGGKKKRCIRLHRKEWKEEFELRSTNNSKNQNLNYFIMLSWDRSAGNIHLINRCGSGQRLEWRSHSSFLWLDPGGGRQEGQNIRDSLDCPWKTLIFFPLSSNQIQFQENNLLLVTYTIHVRKWPLRALHFSCLILAARNRTEFWLSFANPVGLHVGSFCLLTALCFHVEIWPSWFLSFKGFIVKTFIF